MLMQVFVCIWQNEFVAAKDYDGVEIKILKSVPKHSQWWRGLVESGKKIVQLWQHKIGKPVCDVLMFPKFIPKQRQSYELGIYL